MFINRIQGASFADHLCVVSVVLADMPDPSGTPHHHVLEDRSEGGLACEVRGHRRVLGGSGAAYALPFAFVLLNLKKPSVLFVFFVNTCCAGSQRLRLAHKIGGGAERVSGVAPLLLHCELGQGRRGLQYGPSHLAE